jgi:hypothetical protein
MKLPTIFSSLSPFKKDLLHKDKQVWSMERAGTSVSISPLLKLE